jgi:hypothetical protein
MFVFGRAGGDADVVRVGYVFEQLGKVRERLEMYMVPVTEVEDVVV